MKSTGERVLVLLGLLLLIPACGVGGSGGTLTPTVAPGSPSQVKAVAGNGRVTLTWTSAGVGETIVVSRSITAGGPYFPVSVPSGFVAPDTYVDTGLDNDVKYFYVVTASNPFGQSAPSSEVAGEPGFKPISIFTGSGSSNTLSLFEDGTAWGWGGNGAGELATGDFSPASAPIQMAAPPGTIALAGGWNFSLFLLKGGTVWGVGATWEGMLGPLPPDPPMLSPVPIPGLSDIVAISSGGSHGLALRSDGTVWAWGNNTYGQVGNGVPGGIVSTPYQIPSLSGVVAVSAGYYFSLALLDNGTVWAWGQNNYGNCATGAVSNYNPLPTQVLNLNGVLRISGGGTHALALRNDGTVWGWGDASLGQVGHGVTTGVAVTSPVPVQNLTGVTAISAGRNISLALKSDLTVWSWGTNSTTGMLGNGSPTGIVNAPAKITSLAGIKAIAAGGSHAVVMRNDGSLFSWGDNAQGQLGIGATDRSLSPVVVNNFTAGVAIAAGRYHSHALRTGQTVWSWGGNQNGQMANGTSGPATTSIPFQSAPLTFTAVTAIAAGDTHGVAIQGGSVLTWGGNQNGQIGNGGVSATAVVNPYSVGLAGTFIGVDGGWSHTLALRSDGVVFAWGLGLQGQLGTGALPPNLPSPTQVTVLDKAVAVSGGGFHSLALRTDLAVSGAVWSWGSNSSGQLGSGAIGGQNPTPTPVAGLIHMTAVAAGGTHSLALKNDGTVWAWGANSSGQCGNGDPQGATLPNPTQVPGLSGVVAISAGDDYSIVLLSDGTVRAWGKNDFGQLGDETNTLRRSPIQVPGLSGITKITAGRTHTVAADNAGLLWAWGQNDSEQLGKTLVKFSAVPVGISH